LPEKPEHSAGLPAHPSAFRLRRGINWVTIGLTYAAYYVNRYNLSFCSSAICQTFGFNNTQYGAISTGRSWSYALGQFFNGLLADRIGGKQAMAIGGYGTAVMNVLFGLAWYHRSLGPLFGTLAWFIAVRSIDGYLQAFGCPGMVKINAAWFARAERGGFAGVFGLMINIGRFTTNSLIPAILAGFTIWSYTLPKGNWQFAFFIPAGIMVVLTTVMLLVAAPTPEAAGYAGQIPRDPEDTDDEPLPFGLVFRTIMSNPLVWLTAWAYFCTGVVRYGVDEWFPKYFTEVRHLDQKSLAFQWVAWSIPIAATLGSIASGYVSDLFFRGRRAPVAAFLYFLETTILVLGARATSLGGVSVILVMIAFTCNATHSILGSAAPMDFGGRKMAGFAAGVIDSWQYIGAGLAGIGLGKLIDQYGWNVWLYAMAGFGVLGGCLMLVMRVVERRAARGEPACSCP
jgi:OPA family glycerol-3-phosphate transporter-like MFS transporter